MYRNWLGVHRRRFVNRFEAELAARCSARHAIATVNGTSALHAALLAMRIGPGDAVVCPTLTFVATANAIAYCGATPLFADSETDTLSLCPARLGEFLETDCAVSGGRLIHKDTGLRIAVIMPVHLFGHPADMTGPECAADTYDIPVLEDATESLAAHIAIDRRDRLAAPVC